MYQLSTNRLSASSSVAARRDKRGRVVVVSVGDTTGSLAADCGGSCTIALSCGNVVVMLLGPLVADRFLDDRRGVMTTLYGETVW